MILDFMCPSPWRVSVLHITMAKNTEPEGILTLCSVRAVVSIFIAIYGLKMYWCELLQAYSVDHAAPWWSQRYPSWVLLDDWKSIWKHETWQSSQELGSLLPFSVLTFGTWRSPTSQLETHAFPTTSPVLPRALLTTYWPFHPYMQKENWPWRLISLFHHWGTSFRCSRLSCPWSDSTSSSSPQ